MESIETFHSMLPSALAVTCSFFRLTGAVRTVRPAVWPGGDPSREGRAGCNQVTPRVLRLPAVHRASDQRVVGSVTMPYTEDGVLFDDFVVYNSQDWQAAC
ncbi:hypothetical protein ACH45E_06720 [Streptomyces sp. NPDC020299]|uniref:hypothetical protein n=1 Tax=Streptomyces sp. NPDC020299 TaxID=3365067 RepID=UPI0037A9C0B5